MSSRTDGSSPVLCPTTSASMILLPRPLFARDTGGLPVRVLLCLKSIVGWVASLQRSNSAPLILQLEPYQTTPPPVQPSNLTPPRMFIALAHGAPYTPMDPVVPLHEPLSMQNPPPGFEFVKPP